MHEIHMITNNLRIHSMIIMPNRLDYQLINIIISKLLTMHTD